jgi:hypothetical protein
MVEESWEIKIKIKKGRGRLQKKKEKAVGEFAEKEKGNGRL